MNDGTAIRRDRRRGLRHLASWLPLVAGLTGCAGTPWGETLSGSFPPARAPEPVLEAPPASPTPTPAAVAPSPPVKGPSPSAAPNDPQATPRPAAAPQVKAPPPARPSARPSAPTSYRVTIRLPQADPSAPAEAVTQALRAAGISFEVDTIERMKPAASAVPTPDSPDGAASAPSVRPAPPPR